MNKRMTRSYLSFARVRLIVMLVRFIDCPVGALECAGAAASRRTTATVTLPGSLVLLWSRLKHLFNERLCRMEF